MCVNICTRHPINLNLELEKRRAYRKRKELLAKQKNDYTRSDVLRVHVVWNRSIVSSPKSANEEKLDSCSRRISSSYHGKNCLRRKNL